MTQKIRKTWLYIVFVLILTAFYVLYNVSTVFNRSGHSEHHFWWVQGCGLWLSSVNIQCSAMKVVTVDNYLVVGVSGWVWSLLPEAGRVWSQLVVGGAGGHWSTPELSRGEYCLWQSLRHSHSQLALCPSFQLSSYLMNISIICICRYCYSLLYIRSLRGMEWGIIHSMHRQLQFLLCLLFNHFL